MTRHAVHTFEGRYAFLSNFHPSPVYIMVGARWVKCATVEHAYQASKTLHPDTRFTVATADTPGAAKQLGRIIKRVGYWDDVKTIIMLELLRQKFSRSPLRARLKNTHDMHLIEGNHWHDNFWGVCECDFCRDAHTETRTEPLNMLGKLLMRVRKDVR